MFNYSLQAYGQSMERYRFIDLKTGDQFLLWSGLFIE
jgi:hypothetical protein